MSRSNTIIIAEAGVNHNGSVQTAIDMIHAAAKAGVDYVKFQTFKASSLVSASARKAKYQQENCGDDDTSQLAMLKKLELTYEDFRTLNDECRKVGIGFLSTPFDLDSVDFLSTLNMDYMKIPSGEITNLPYLRRIAKYGGKVILSTGMSDIDDVYQAVNALTESGITKSDIYLLHCTTQYPTPFKDVNLKAMDTLALLGCAGVGYSDHTKGITVPIAAVARGAMIIEKHFTLDRSMPGPDHKASLEPGELSCMVKAIRHTEAALGNGEKVVTESERQNIAIARKSIVASKPIAKGDKLTPENITTKRPGTGLSPMLWDKILNTPAKRDFNPDEQIEIDDIL